MVVFLFVYFLLHTAGDDGGGGYGGHLSVGSFFVWGGSRIGG